MKRRLIILCSVFLIFNVFSLSVSAEDVSVITRVPDSHEVFVSVMGEGFVEADAYQITNGKLNISRQKSQEYTIVPAEGYELERLFYNGRDVTSEVSDGRFIASPITSDSRMSVFLTKRISSEKEVSKIICDDGFFLTGESDRSVFFIVVFLVSCGAIAACLIIRKKRTDKR